MHNTGMLLSDVLTGYVNGKPVDIGMIAKPIQKQNPASSDQ